MRVKLILGALLSAAVFLLAADESSGATIVSNNFDGNDGNDIGGTFGIVSNNNETLDATDPSSRRRIRVLYQIRSRNLFQNLTFVSPSESNNRFWRPFDPVVKTSIRLTGVLGVYKLVSAPPVSSTVQHRMREKSDPFGNGFGQLDP